MVLYFISNAPLVDLILLNTTSVGQSRRIKNANLGRSDEFYLFAIFNPLELTNNPVLLLNS